MSWFRKDDGTPRHPKMRGAIPDARALWDAAGPECARENSDGLVLPIVVRDAAYLAEISDVTAACASLVDQGLWHDHRTIRKCDKCSEVVAKLLSRRLREGEFYFHDWLDYQLPSEAQVLPDAKWKERRKRQLSHMSDLLETVVRRDRGRCRYCTIPVNFAARRGPERGTYDHVDPWGENTLANIVVACGHCNGEKKDRTPEEWGFMLWPEPDSDLTPVRNGPIRRPYDGLVMGIADLTSRARDARDGSGRVGAEPVSNPGQNGASNGHSNGVH